MNDKVNENIKNISITQYKEKNSRFLNTIINEFRFILTQHSWQCCVKRTDFLVNFTQTFAFQVFYSILILIFNI